MKTLLALIISLTSLSALAGEIKVYDRPTWEYGQAYSYSPSLEINKDLGRAWVNISFVTLGDGPLYSDKRVQIEGLSYNSTTNQVLLDVEGTQIVCANVKTSRVFGTNIKPTGNCTFKQKNYTVEVDNGFEIEKVQKIKITLNY